nr:hypothetical protein [Tanacetum cinerariifolium]
MNGKKPLTLDFNTFTTSTGLDYNNGAYVSHPSLEVLDGNFSSTERVNSFQQLITYSLITRTKVEIWEIIYSDLKTKLLNKSRLRYVSYPRFISCALEVLLGLEYTQDEKFRYLLGILSNSNFSEDPSKVTKIELTAHMIAVNNQKDLVSPLPLSTKKKKGESHTVTLTLPKSQGPKAFGALSKKRKQPKPKKIHSETKGSSPKPTKGFEQSHSVSSGTIPDPQDLERNIQLASTGLPSTLDEGTRKSQPLPEGTGAKGPDIKSLQLKTFTDVQALLLFDDEMVQESNEEEVFEAGEDMDEDTQTYTEVYGDLLNALNGVTKALKAIQDALKEDHVLNKKVLEAIEAYTKNFTHLTKLLTLIKNFDFQ